MTDPTRDTDSAASGKRVADKPENGHAGPEAAGLAPKPQRARKAPSDRAASSPVRAVTALPKPTAVPVAPSTNGGSADLIRTEALTITQGGANRVDAGSITINQGGIGEATAGRVEIRQGGIGRLEAEEAFVAQGAIGLARGERVRVEMGAVGAAIANDVHVTQGAVGMVLSRQATVGQTVVRTLVAQEVRFDRPSGVLVMLAARVSGDVRPVLDWRGALAFGAAFGLLVGLFRGVRPRR